MWSGSSNSLCTIWIFFETAIISVVSLSSNGQLWTKDPYFDGRLVNFNLYSLGQNDLLSATTGSACAALTEADEGVRYFKRDAEDWSCPSWLGYDQEKYSGICCKVYTFSTDFLTARDLCQDTDEKVQGIIAVLMNTSAFHNQWFHSGASRPADEWDTPWVASSNFFCWEQLNLK